MKSHFVYMWRDNLRNRYYIGSHTGSETDGYICSSEIMLQIYNTRTRTFSRRILEYCDSKEHLLERETVWLQKINIDDLGRKYYNLKNVAQGGDTYTNLTEDKKTMFRKKCSDASHKRWKNISDEEYKKAQETAFGGNTFSRDYLIQRNKDLCSKTARITKPCGEEILVTNIREFCIENNINYGNMKTVCRGNGKSKSCQGYRGSYV